MLTFTLTPAQVASINSVGLAAASKNDVTAVICSVKITITPGEVPSLSAIATDRYVAARTTFTVNPDTFECDGNEPVSVVLSTTALADVVRLSKLRGLRSLLATVDDGGNVVFNNYKSKIVVAGMNVNYPPVEKLLPDTTELATEHALPASVCLDLSLLARLAKLTHPEDGRRAAPAFLMSSAHAPGANPDKPGPIYLTRAGGALVALIQPTLMLNR